MTCSSGGKASAEICLLGPAVLSADFGQGLRFDIQILPSLNTECSPRTPMMSLSDGSKELVSQSLGKSFQLSEESASVVISIVVTFG